MYFKGSIVHIGFEEELFGAFDNEKEFVINAHYSNHGRPYLSIVVDYSHSSVEYPRELVEKLVKEI